MNRTSPDVVETMLDHASYPRQHHLTEAWVADNLVYVDWSDGPTSHFHAIWLRDNCACPVCRHPYALERQFLFIDQPETPLIAEANIEQSGNLKVTFAAKDGEASHVSIFDAGW
ncbi:MAG: gamma-butyrobetaine hydroxylase-like domain-containing protein, partial [Rhodospirillales bacterium]|nr:gamma-butyrobetaine hydroxylase-like domain-containing protein [Rhodospirillales bacterium]